MTMNRAILLVAALASFGIVTVRAQDRLNVTASSDALTLAANYGCSRDSQYWRRDASTELCTARCAHDDDCPAGLGRCRIIDFGDPSPVPSIIFVDDVAPNELSAWLVGTNPALPPVTWCDPFYDNPYPVDGNGMSP